MVIFVRGHFWGDGKTVLDLGGGYIGVFILLKVHGKPMCMLYLNVKVKKKMLPLNFLSSCFYNPFECFK